MASCIISKLNPDAPAFIPTNLPVTETTMFAYRSKNENIWSPARGWLKSYRCKACKVIFAKKDGPKFPQRIKNCDHIVCARCITTSYYINKNPMCPVSDCGICVNHL